jgi:glutamate-1-semialdehyde aminotransferase
VSDPGVPAPADAAFRARAAAVILGGASTGSKRPDVLYGPGAAAGPTHFESAAGCELVTVGGRRIVDCTMALGSVALGYAHPAVTEAVVAAARAGNVSALSHRLEVELAERLCATIPCAERVRFLKSGAEGCAAAVRIARAATGRAKVVGCGYFGWLDWWSGGPGVPAGAHADYAAVPFDDVAALEGACAWAGGDLAAVMLEPVVERLPSPEWLAAARAICDRAGAVLVFDEVKTGFRVAAGGYQAVGPVTPDVAVFAKAMANGYPLAAVVGRAAVMEAARGAWISSTLASEGTALAAAGAVLDVHAASDVCGVLREAGGALQTAAREAVAASGVDGVAVHGIAPMWFLRFDDVRREERFVAAALDAGVLLKRGAYNFASLAHDGRAVARAASAIEAGLAALAAAPAHATAVARA